VLYESGSFREEEKFFSLLKDTLNLRFESKDVLPYATSSNGGILPVL